MEIEITHIDQLTAQLTMRGKGGKLREVPLRRDVLEQVQCYIKGEQSTSKHATSPKLLVSLRVPKMHGDAVRRWLQQTGEQLGFHIHPYMLRHTFCTQLLKKGVDITTVYKLAGHANLNTTIKHYINISKEKK